MTDSRTHDIVVVGARCAGSATAMLLARRGYDVALVDPTPMPRDTLSTHAISRSATCSTPSFGKRPRRLEPPRTWSVSPSGTFYTYVRGLGATGFEYHLGLQSLIGVFPTHNDEACVWICAPDAALEPLLRAGNHGDPITGHGISDAFRDAELLTTAVDRHLGGGVPWSVAGVGYDQARAAALHDIFAITQALTHFPALEVFIALQKELSGAITSEALMLAALPTDRTHLVLVA